MGALQNEAGGDALVSFTVSYYSHVHVGNVAKFLVLVRCRLLNKFEYDTDTQ